jgi:hypothetical protein
LVAIILQAFTKFPNHSDEFRGIFSVEKKNIFKLFDEIQSKNPVSQPDLKN